VDRVRTMILVGVAAKNGENPFRRRGQGSSAMFVSRGLADPKALLNRKCRKGSRLIFLRRGSLCLSSDASGYAEQVYLLVQVLKLGKNRNGENLVNVRVGGRKSSSAESRCP
jgi:hypothetical protein